MKKDNTDINNTAVVPYIIAEQVTDDIGEQDYLISRSERHYKDNEIWRKQFNKSKDQRQFLKMFMEHWKESYNKKIKKQ